MKLFGLEIEFRSAAKKKQDSGRRFEKLLSERMKPQLSTRSPKSVGATHNLSLDNIPKIFSPVRDYEYSGSRTEFLEPEWDLAEIGRLATGESYFARAIRIKTALMLKEGWTLVGKDTDAVDYIRYRIKQIELSTKEPFNLLLWRTASDLIQCSNAFWVKVRKPGVPGTKTRPIKGREKDLDPVAGYFYLPAETVQFNKRKNTGVRYYKQVLPDGEEKTFPAENVVHFTYDKRAGLTIGTPQVISAIDDIKLLRRLEENVSMLVHKHLFPLFHYTVGTMDTPAKKDPKTGLDEVDVVKRIVEEMPPEGVYVSDHRHNIKVVGAENKALRIESYLQHAKQRVFAGLAISPIDVGELGTSNKATSETASRAMIDNVKDYQKLLAEQINFYVITELLLESSLNTDGTVLADDKMVYFQFPEIDIESKIKIETHAMQKWMQNAISHPELRKILGEDPMSDDDWNETYYNKVQKDIVLIQSIDEQSGLKSSADRKRDKETARTSKSSNPAKKSTSSNDSTIRPANQYGKLTGPNKFKNALKDGYLLDEAVFKDVLLNDINMSYNNREISRTYKVVLDSAQDTMKELHRSGIKKPEIYQAVIEAAAKTFYERINTEK